MVTKLKVMKKLIVVLMLSGCASIKPLFPDPVSITDPTERGLVYVAYAIIVGALVRGVFR